MALKRSRHSADFHLQSRLDRLDMDTILIIDDDEDYRETASIVLSEAGHIVFEAESPDAAFPILLQNEVDLILCDLHMPFTKGPNQAEYLNSMEVGIRTVQELHEALPTARIAVVTAIGPRHLASIKSILNPVPVFTKPDRPYYLCQLVEEVSVSRPEEMVHLVDC